MSRPRKIQRSKSKRMRSWSVTHSRPVSPDARLIATTNGRHRQLYFNDAYSGVLGVLNEDRTELRRDFYFPSQEAAICYLVTKKLGYPIKKPNYGHWIDSNWWTPVCLTPPQIQEVEDG